MKMTYMVSSKCKIVQKAARCAALFLLTTKERYQLTQPALDFITQQIQHMISFAVDDIDEAVRNYLAEQGLRGTPFSNKQLESLCRPIHAPSDRIFAE